jgi:NAD(P)-dependent dehydrogenase (short-subunit alcohol dehydrogenase family)
MKSDTEAKVVLVTGSAGGVGSAVVDRFGAGWRVVRVDIVEQDARPDSLAIRADLRNVGDCRSAVEQAVAWGGRLDAVVNSAGLWTEGPCDETTEADWDRVMGVNLKGLYFLTSAAVPHLKRTEGCVVNLSSDAGLQGNAGAAVYCASKGAVSVLTKALALELAPFGVRMNAVCPGDIDTPMLAGQARDHGGDDPAAYLERLRSGYPQGAGRSRFVQPSEVAEMIWYLCQPHAAPITGANISIDFGLSAGIV